MDEKELEAVLLTAVVKHYCDIAKQILRWSEKNHFTTGELLASTALIVALYARVLGIEKVFEIIKMFYDMLEVIEE